MKLQFQNRLSKVAFGMLILAILSMIVLRATAQTKAVKDAQGNYSVKRADTALNKATGHTITLKDGTVYPLFLSSRGKLFYNKTAKSGNVYKVYVKEV